ncbi:MAG: DUF3131 domain-containing protein [Elusimicrobia bacterium]|nr:DUF3131 domain-containing protein [Elusimicrobiota bacterium]
MKRLLPILALLCLWVFARAGKNPLPEHDQQSRVYRFKPVQYKTIDSYSDEKPFLNQVARDTWGYFRDLVDKQTGMPLDNVLIASTYTKVNSYTSTTNMGLYLMCLVSAEDFGYIARGESLARARRLLATLRGVDHWEGQYFNYYETITTDASSRFVSSVDNGWLAAGLIVARQAYPELETEIDPMLRQMDFSKLFDAEAGQLYLGYDADKKKPTESHYGLLCTEPRLASYIGIAKGDLPHDHWYKLFRTLPLDWDWQNQKPKGKIVEKEGVPVFYGYYERNKVRWVPSWGGSLFEFLMPTLVLDEGRLSPKGLGANNKIALDAQIRYALEERRYPVWGLSPCATPDDPLGYKEYGVPYLGAKGYRDDGVVTPHVSFLALSVDAPRAVENIRRLARFRNFYGEYGFYDSINVKTGHISPRYLALDQAMTLVALNNYLNNGAIQKRFWSHSLIQAQSRLLRDEVFF